MLINGTQIFRKPVQNVTDEVGVEELHCGVNNVVDHVLVQLDGRSSCYGKQRHDAP